MEKAWNICFLSELHWKQIIELLVLQLAGAASYNKNKYFNNTVEAKSKIHVT